MSAPVVGTTHIEHVRELIDAVDIKLTPEEIVELEQPYRTHPVAGHAHPRPAEMLGRTGKR